MGRSVSCFKIITCAGDSDENDDLQASENKSSSEKSRWSFRKRSARHRVLSNTVITESPYSANKETSNSATRDFQSPDPSTDPEKISLIHCPDEKAHLPTSVDSKASENSVVAEVNSEKDAQLQEPVVIVVQTAVRGFLAQKELLKLKNLVKLQAVVRGHLVRRHAIGTLRCVQALVRIQTLYRARQTRLLQEGEKKIDRTEVKANSRISGKGNSTESPTYVSLNKLLSNKFARQLMESTPKERPIYIDCDPAKPSSAWNWFERWMSVSSAEPTPRPEQRTEQAERENNDNSALQEETVVPSAGPNEIADSESHAKENHLPSLTNENSATYDKDDFMSQQPHLTNPLAKDNSERPNSGKLATSDVEEPSTSLDSLPAQNVEPNVKPQTESTLVHQKEEVEGEQTDQPKRSMKRNASDSLETLEAEGKKFVSGSRKVSNPSFLAAHSKFEELSSTTNSNGPISFSNQDGGVDPKIEPTSLGANTVVRTNDLNAPGSSLPNDFSSKQHGGSECGTELSVTSTLDSPDVSEVGVAEPEGEQEVKSPEQETCIPDITKDVTVTENVFSDQVPDLPESVPIEPEKHEGESADIVIAAESPVIEKPERSASDVQREIDFKIGGSQYRTSPEASPSSHITVPESLGTPSSELSVSNKKNRSKSASNQKRKSLSAAKGSPFNPNNNSGVRDSMEKLAKDQENGKRRNSFGSSRADRTDQEPRDSSSSSSVPRFMQATESARAKLQDNMSPRSSPDVQDREYVKKRHSLPGANGRQGSPRVKRSMSQAQPGSKASVVVHEKKWQR